MLKCNVEGVAALGHEIKVALDHYYVAESTMDSMLDQITDGTVDVAMSDEGLVEEESSDADAPIIKLVSLIILEAYRNRASDIHLEPLEKRFRVRYRIDGVLHEVDSPMFEGKIFKGSNKDEIENNIDDTPQSVHELLSYAYYVGNSGRSCAGAAVPSLMRVRMGPTGQPLTDELLPGVEHFQVQYGVDDGVTGLRYLNANAVTDFNQVTTARIWLLMRAECAETGFTDGKTYTLGGQDYTPNDGFRRQLYSSVIMLRNG